jgi:type I restriction enzyme R subunit
VLLKVTHKNGQMDTIEKLNTEEDIYSLLKTMGYHPLSSTEVRRLRGGTEANPLLEDILKQQLNRLNQIEYKGSQYKFSARNIEDAFFTLKYAASSDYNRMFHLLRYGRVYPETIRSDSKSFTINFIDWENIENNEYHIARGFETGFDNEKVWMDMVLFVNGIPLVLMDFRSSGGSGNALFKLWQLMNDDSLNPTPISFAQLLLSFSSQYVEYNTTYSGDTAWPVWNGPLNNLCSPQQLLDLMKRFILSNPDTKYIARHHQMNAVHKTLEKIKLYNPDGSRKGGVISHTAGSGILYTMIFLSQNLLLEKNIDRARVLIVTDRTEMDEQIGRMFSQFILPAVTRATTSGHLLELLKEDTPVVTTVMNKFYTFPDDYVYSKSTTELFILIDEVQRGYSGAFYRKMREIFPSACYIGFTRTPFSRKEIVSQHEFFDLIDAYTLEHAVERGVVLPIIYEQRITEANKVLKSLPGAAAFNGPWNKLRKSTAVFSAKESIREIGDDITRHFYIANKGTGFKGLLATPSKAAAVGYWQYFQEKKGSDRFINAAIIISDMSGSAEHDSAFSKYYREMLSLYGSQKEYEADVLQKVKTGSDEIELLIVVDRLLTGFDAPYINTLYLARYMQEHTLMQAIARVNRPAEGKPYGQVIDYVGAMSENIGMIPLKEEAQKLDEYFGTLSRLVIQGETSRAFVKAVVQCKSILQLTDFSETSFKMFTKPKIRKYQRQLLTFEEVAQKIMTDRLPPATGSSSQARMADIRVPDKTPIPPILNDHQLATSFFVSLKEILEKTGARLPDKKVAEYCLLTAGEVTKLMTRDWQTSTKAHREISNFLEDSILIFTRQYNTQLSFTEIDNILDLFLDAAQHAVTD